MVITDSLRAKYIGKLVNIYPDDTYYKEAIIEDLDECGWTFRMTEKSSKCNAVKPGDTWFINHAKIVSFKFLN